MIPQNPDSPPLPPTVSHDEVIVPEIVKSETKIIENNMNVENAGTSTFMSRLEEIEKEEEICPKTPSRITDGIILIAKKEDTNFLNPNDISPILKNKYQDESLHRITEEDGEEEDELADFSTIACNKELFKRKRPEDSFDNISLASTDSLAPSFSSAKKPKLTRTGSITRNLRRSMSFAAIKTPLANMLRSRRNSVDPNASITSISSINSTFNESIKKPVKEKLRSIKDKITKSSKKEINTPKTVKTLISSTNIDSLKKVCKIKAGSSTEHTDTDQVDDSCQTEFKTPLAPPRTPRTFNKSMITSSEFLSVNVTPTTIAFDKITKNTSIVESPKIQENADETKPVQFLLFFVKILVRVWIIVEFLIVQSRIFYSGGEIFKGNFFFQ